MSSERNGGASDYWELTKPRINFLIAISTFTGFIAANRANAHTLSVPTLLHTIGGTLLVASGTNALNQYIERRYDSQMARTARRPIPAGRVSARSAFWFAIILSILGFVDLYRYASPLAALIGMLTSLTYLIVYTPLKRITPLSILVGAIAGAAPPLIGWSGYTGTLSGEAWLLFSFQMLWQYPHFMAIAWLYRSDYKRAGYRVLPDGPAASRVITIQTLLPCAVLVAASFIVPPREFEPTLYRLAASGLAIGLVYFVLTFVNLMCAKNARKLLLASVMYLPLLFLLRIAI